jgi:hypothetical protein
MPLFDGPSQDETTALLIRARGFIERGWCRKAFACDIEKNRVLADSFCAVSWCAEGALIATGVHRGGFF